MGTHGDLKSLSLKLYPGEQTRWREISINAPTITNYDQQFWNASLWVHSHVQCLLDCAPRHENELVNINNERMDMNYFNDIN